MKLNLPSLMHSFFFSCGSFHSKLQNGVCREVSCGYCTDVAPPKQHLPFPSVPEMAKTTTWVLDMFAFSSMSALRIQECLACKGRGERAMLRKVLAISDFRENSCFQVLLPCNEKCIVKVTSSPTR